MSGRGALATASALLALVALVVLARGQEEVGGPTSAERTNDRPGPVPRDWRSIVGPGPESVPVKTLDGAPYVTIGDFARLLDATKYWRGDLRKLELRARSHRLQLTVDNPFVVVDDRTVRLDVPVRSRNGEIHVPVALVDSLPRDSSLARLFFDPGRQILLRVPPAGIVSGPRIAVDGGATRLTFPVDHPDEVVVAGRGRAHFRIRFSGSYAGILPTEFPAGSLVRGMRPLATAGGSAFEFEVHPLATGFRLTPDGPGRRVHLVFTSDPNSDLEPFAPEGPPGPRAIRSIVLDPGHGGSDAGVTASGLKEKELTLALARLLKAELERRGPVRVVLTRDDDREVGEAERAEHANRARADLVLALHFDGLRGSRAHGVTAYCPPATFGTRQRNAQALIALLPWRDVGLRHAVASRELAEDVLSSIELRAQGPVRLREVLPYPLLGVNAPGLLLECGTLTSEADRARLERPNGLAELAATIADGIQAYQRNE